MGGLEVSGRDTARSRTERSQTSSMCSIDVSVKVDSSDGVQHSFAIRCVQPGNSPHQGRPAYGPGMSGVHVGYPRKPSKLKAAAVYPEHVTEAQVRGAPSASPAPAAGGGG